MLTVEELVAGELFAVKRFSGYWHISESECGGGVSATHEISLPQHHFFPPKGVPWAIPGVDLGI